MVVESSQVGTPDEKNRDLEMELDPHIVAEWRIESCHHSPRLASSSSTP